MHSLEVFFGLIFIALVVAAMARHCHLPIPIVLVLGGLALGLVPGLPKVALDPHLVFFVLLPPILFGAAYFTSWRDFWRWRRAIFLLSFGLVFFTSAAVAALCVYFIPGITWATGFVLGAIVSPPDAAAATSIMRGLRLPRRIVQILEGESLVNDAAGLTVYRFAVAAVVTSQFSLQEATITFLWISLGGIVIGAVLGWLFVKCYPWLRDSDIEILMTFMLSYGAYSLAELAHASGVLATVVAGLILGWHSPELFSAHTRLRGTAVWQSVIFFFEIVIFVLIGLQLPEIFASLGGYPLLWLVKEAFVISLGVIVIRFLWVFPAAYLPHYVSSRIRATEPTPSWQGVTIVSWTGLRGVVSLAAALALPEETASGLPFPYRSLVLFLTFAVILVTIVLQGGTLRRLVAWLHLPEDVSSEAEILRARLAGIEHALERMSQLEEQKAAPQLVLDRVRGYFEDRLADARAQLDLEEGSETPERPEGFQTLAEQRIWWELARAEREAVVRLRREQRIGDEALRHIEGELDLLEARLVPQAAAH